MIYCIDVDDVCADFVTAWLRRYNRDYNDHLIPDDLTDWDTSKFVKPECGTKIFEYIEDATLYDEIGVEPYALWGVDLLRKRGHRVIFLTASRVGHMGRKFTWLKDNGFKPEVHNYIEASDKSLIMGNVLLDDRYKNAKGFKGRGVLMKRNWSTIPDGPIDVPYVENWKDFIHYVDKEGML